MCMFGGGCRSTVDAHVVVLVWGSAGGDPGCEVSECGPSDSMGK